MAFGLFLLFQLSNYRLEKFHNCAGCILTVLHKAVKIISDYY